MKKVLQVIDEKTGELLEDIKFDGGYNIVYNNKMDQGNLLRVRKLDNGKFGDRHWIKNYYYRPVAEKLIEKFEEISHIDSCRILFIEDTEWEPGTANNPWIAKTKLSNREFAHMTGYDYIIEFRQHFIERMQREQIIALIYHELRHIGIDGKLVNHDVEDWGNMVATLGVDWATTRGSIPDLIDELGDWNELDSAAKQLNMFRLKAVK